MNKKIKIKVRNNCDHKKKKKFLICELNFLLGLEIWQVKSIKAKGL